MKEVTSRRRRLVEYDVCSGRSFIVMSTEFEELMFAVVASH